MRRTMVLMIAVALALSACFSLGRDTPPLRQYVLAGASAVATDAAPPDPSGLTLGVRRLDLATYLTTESIVVRRGAHGMLTDDFNRWGEDPERGINRAFASHLAATAPVRAVDVSPWPVRSQHDYLVQLHVSRFEGVLPDSLATVGEAHLRATWELSLPQNSRVVARGSTDYRADGWRAGDYAGLVGLLDRGLDSMAGDIVRCIARAGAADPVDSSGAIVQALVCS
jgi:uncharacterized protein